MPITAQDYVTQGSSRFIHTTIMLKSNDKYLKIKAETSLVTARVKRYDSD